MIYVSRAGAPVEEERQVSETDDRQKAMTVCSIGTQPVIPAV